LDRTEQYWFEKGAMNTKLLIKALVFPALCPSILHSIGKVFLVRKGKFTTLFVEKPKKIVGIYDRQRNIYLTFHNFLKKEEN